MKVITIKELEELNEEATLGPLSYGGHSSAGIHINDRYGETIFVAWDNSTKDVYKNAKLAVALHNNLPQLIEHLKDADKLVEGDNCYCTQTDTDWGNGILVCKFCKYKEKWMK